MTNPKAVIFDMDGVLIDAREWHFQALNDALRLFGYEIGLDEHLSRFDGLPTRDKLRLLSQSNSLPLELHKLINSVKQERTLRIAAAACYPQAHHLILMATLKRHGIKIGVATNSVRKTTETMLTYAGLVPYLDVIVTNQDVKNAKPHPEIYLTAMSKLGVSADEVVVVEDNPHGIAAARAAGARVCEVRDPSEVHTETLKPYFKGGLL